MAEMSWGSLRKTAEDASKPLPKDWYDVTVEKAENTVASTGSPMIKATLQVMSGPQAGNRKVWTQFVFKPDSPFALQMFFKNLAAFGLDDAFFNTLPANPEAGMPIIAAKIQGASARALIGPRAYQGTERDNVEELSAPQGGGARPTSIAPAPTAAAAGAAPAAPVPAGASPIAPTPSVAPAPQSVPQGQGPSAPPQLAF